MNQTPFDLLVDAIKLNVSTIRALIVTNLILIAIMFSNIYLQSYSLDQQHILETPYLIDKMKERIGEIKDKYEKPNEMTEQDLIQLSYLVANVTSLENMLEKSSPNRNVDIPLIGQEIPASDVDVIVAIFMLAIWYWANILIGNIHLLTKDLKKHEKIGQYTNILRHILYGSANKNSKNTHIFFISYLPAITITFSLYQDVKVYSIYSDAMNDYAILTGITDLLVARIVVLFLSVIGLCFLGFRISRSWLESIDSLDEQRKNDV